MRIGPTSRDIIETFTGRWLSPTQRQLDALHYQFGVPVTAMMHDIDGGGFPMGMLRVERSGRTFDFTADPSVTPLCGFLAWDRWDEAQDIVGWSPRDGWIGTWLGRAALLNEHELFWPRLDGPLPVYADVLPWLRSERSGCVILNRKRARGLLEGVRMVAATIEDGLAIRRLLSAPEPNIVVQPRATQQVAA